MDHEDLRAFFRGAALKPLQQVLHAMSDVARAAPNLEMAFCLSTTTAKAVIPSFGWMRMWLR